MAIKVVYTSLAKNDLKEIYEFIARGSLYYAKKEINDIRIVIKRLKQEQYLGKMFEGTADELVRELIFKNYRIIYAVNQDIEVSIITIHHHARSISNNPAFKPED